MLCHPMDVNVSVDTGTSPHKGCANRDVYATPTRGTAHTTHPHSPRSHATPTLRRDVYAAPRRGTVRTTVYIYVLVHKDPMKNTLKVLDGLTFCSVFEKLSAAQKRYLCLPRRLMHGAIELCMDEPFWLACGAAARMMSA
eukprot:COSAG02_NODE_3476_length_6675_cov_38.602342_7_plen_140_part_00